eukprot:TRINITY_DN8241_c0_g1_i1.p1 TRINITY_DN8241_c0_g1~~TRINITY_DN8241_c0_g1_i1.p1  ORF type:complete len:121 (+),score=12.91 TRINITY_DN8241_c0_g1_i1:34-363(+)
MREITDPIKNHANYRAAIENSEVPAVPYVGIFLTDLVYIDEGNKDFIGDKINFKKQELVFGVLKKMRVFQARGYDYVRLEPLARLLTHVPFHKAKEAYEISLLIQPRKD